MHAPHVRSHQHFCLNSLNTLLTTITFDSRCLRKQHPHIVIRAAAVTVQSRSAQTSGMARLRGGCRLCQLPGAFRPSPPSSYSPPAAVRASTSFTICSSPSKMAPIPISIEKMARTACKQTHTNADESVFVDNNTEHHKLTHIHRVSNQPRSAHGAAASALAPHSSDSPPSLGFD